jgi:uncharacterized SAM-binding protein YcdF (DUF218 family)
LLVILWLLGFIFFIYNISTLENVIDKKADAIIVLTGAKGRIDTGIQLLWQKNAAHLFVSGVGKNAVLSDLSKYLDSFTSNQIKSIEDFITLGHEANSTEENALETAQWIKDNNYKSIILVTSNYHIPRSLYLFKHFMPHISIIAHPSKNKNISLKLAFLEYNKFIFCILQYFSF